MFVFQNVHFFYGEVLPICLPNELRIDAAGGAKAKEDD
jgi:hypothetical protein